MSSPGLQIEQVKTEYQLKQALGVRRRVFIEGQAVPETIERDDFDLWRPERDDVLHLVGFLGGEPIAAGRIVFKRPGGGLPKIGRIAILQAFRGRGFGMQVMEALHSYGSARGIKTVTLSAQCHAISFYQSMGYRPRGDVFLEAGIEHQMMDCVLSDGSHCR